MFQSVIIAICNGEKWIDDCFESILQQDALPAIKIEVSVFNDCSTDETCRLLLKWKEKISTMCNISIVIGNGVDVSKGGKV